MRRNYEYKHEDSEEDSQDYTSSDYQIENKEQDKVQIYSIYYFSEAEINQKINSRNRRQKAFTIEFCQTRLKDHLSSMILSGYDFKYKKWTFQEQEKGKSFPFKYALRNILMKYKCLKCKNGGDKAKIWTSILGLVQIRYCICNITKFLYKFPKFLPQGLKPKGVAKDMKYPKMVLWEIVLYREKCLKCFQWGTPAIYDEPLEGISMDFCRVIQSELIGLPVQQKLKKANYHGNMYNLKHKKQLCEACSLGKCFYISKSEAKKKMITVEQML